MMVLFCRVVFYSIKSKSRIVVFGNLLLHTALIDVLNNKIERVNKVECGIRINDSAKVYS